MLVEATKKGGGYGKSKSGYGGGGKSYGKKHG